MKPDIAECLSLAWEAATGADSIPTIERMYDRTHTGAYLCVFPDCRFPAGTQRRSGGTFIPRMGATIYRRRTSTGGDGFEMGAQVRRAHVRRHNADRRRGRRTVRV